MRWPQWGQLRPSLHRAAARSRLRSVSVSGVQICGRYAARRRLASVPASTRELVARRYQVVRHRTRLKNEVPSILHAHLIQSARTPICSTLAVGRGWLLNRCRNGGRDGRMVRSATEQKKELAAIFATVASATKKSLVHLIRRAQVIPMLCAKVAEGQQSIAIVRGIRAPGRTWRGISVRRRRSLLRRPRGSATNRPSAGPF